jgi:protein O-GlcNAc transferase
MGLFDRFRPGEKAASNASAAKADISEPNSLTLISEGNALEDAGRFEDALKCYEAAIQQSPRLARAHLNCGNVLLAMGKAEEARDALQAAINLDPTYAAAHFNLGNASAQMGRHEEALQAYREAIRLKPDFVDAEVAQGCVQQDIGRFKDAVESYRRALEIRPDYVEVHGNLGSVLRKLGQSQEAAASYRRALEINPGSVEMCLELGITLSDSGQHDEALTHLRRGLEIKSDYAELHKARGAVLFDLGRMEEAKTCFRRALELDPGSAIAHCRLGDVQREFGQLDVAVVSYRRALEIAPDFVIGLMKLGTALGELKQPEAAIVNYQRALEIEPDSVIALNNLGNLQKELGQFDAAVASYQHALEVNPAFEGALYNLGNALKELGRFDEAVMNYQRALKIKPDYVGAYCNLGLVQIVIGQLDAAEASLNRALEIDPNLAEAHNNLGGVFKERGQLKKALMCIRKSLEFNPNASEAQGILLYLHTCLADLSDKAMLAEAKRYGELVAKSARPYSSWRNTAEPNRCLRIGFVSGDFCYHPVGFFLESILVALKAQASDRMKVFAYSSRIHFDHLSERIKANCEEWQLVVGLSDEKLAYQIREDRIDVLVDLSGHTDHHRLPLFAWKPAPVQASWLGYFATTGVEAIDYLIAAPWTLPATEEVYFTEKIWRLPETRLCFTVPDEHIDVAPPPAMTNGYITFGSFNNLTKMNEAVVSLWSRVLKAVPGSRLLLKTKQLQEASVRQDIVAQFSQCGIDADRLLLESHDSRVKYFEAYHRIDIALDPFPYPGGTTTVEGLWMGVPVITLAGERFLSRQGVGLLMNCGLSEWVAADADAYVACAVSHAANLPALAQLRKGLRQQVLDSPIFDAPRFARYFEEALRGMWVTWCSQQ